MLIKWLRAVLQIMFVFMYSYTEAAVAENMATVTHTSVCRKPNRIYALIFTDTSQDLM